MLIDGATPHRILWSGAGIGIAVVTSESSISRLGDPEQIKNATCVEEREERRRIDRGKRSTGKKLRDLMVGDMFPHVS